MPYTPPAGNSVNFVFSSGGYAPPAGGAVAFVFGGGGGGGGTPLPFNPFLRLLQRRRLNKKWHRGWRPRPLRIRFAQAPGTIVVPLQPFRNNKMFYRLRFTSKWHKGWKPRPKNRRFVWQRNLTNAHVTWIGQEVVNKGDTTQNVRVTWAAMEVANYGDAVQPVRITWVGLEVICSLQGLDDGILTLIL